MKFVELQIIKTKDNNFQNKENALKGNGYNMGQKKEAIRGDEHLSP